MVTRAMVWKVCERSTWRRLIVLLALACGGVGFVPLSRSAQASALAARGGRFAIDDVPSFLVFVSYFHGLDRPDATLAADFSWLRSKGVSGLRVWPNVSQPPLMRASGELDPVALDRLKRFLAEAAANRMVVDVTFTREHVDGLTLEAYAGAATRTARELSLHRNALFDLQNEWNCGHGGNRMTFGQLQAMRRSIADADPARLVTASVSCHPHPRAGAEAFDLLAYHGPRDAAGGWARGTGDLVLALRAQLAASGRPAVPIYLQEPNRFAGASADADYYDDEPSHYLEALRLAIGSGAAAWTFHTAASFDLSSTTPFAELLLPGEREVVDGLAALIEHPLAP